MTRSAACSCGQLSIACEGEPVRVSVCHCLACQKRTGSAFGSAAFFPKEGAKITGDSHSWERKGEDGPGAVFHFCPTCGATVFWWPKFRPDSVAVAIGAFADPTFPPPDKQVYVESAHPWAIIDGVVSE